MRFPVHTRGLGCHQGPRRPAAAQRGHQQPGDDARAGHSEVQDVCVSEAERESTRPFSSRGMRRFPVQFGDKKHCNSDAPLVEYYHVNPRNNKVCVLYWASVYYHMLYVTSSHIDSNISVLLKWGCQLQTWTLPCKSVPKTASEQGGKQTHGGA